MDLVVEIGKLVLSGIIGGVISPFIVMKLQDRQEIKKYNREERRLLSKDIRAIVTEAENGEYLRDPRDREHIAGVRNRIRLFMPELIKTYNEYIRLWDMQRKKMIRPPEFDETEKEALKIAGVYLQRKALELANK